MAVRTDSGKVVYLGHATIVKSSPEQTDEVVTKSYWSFDTSVDVQWNKDGVLEYLREMGAESVWLQREIVEVKKKS